ncbi:tyrosine-type recombinase/integrase [Photobacterium leiognathi]|uniref:tyrosine-type recombinase/integrase n=1 Tax=Photobacterium leiognathi TaxID=553611 RepID=UPI002981CF24|nr:tyrosine-type recombinase/integrase [Photobacterium leiognathi]
MANQISIYTSSSNINEQKANNSLASSGYDQFRDPQTPFSSLVLAVDELDNEFRNCDIVTTTKAGDDVPLVDIKLALMRWLEIINNRYAVNTIKSLNNDLTIYINLCHKFNINPFNITDREFINITEQRRIDCKPSTMSRFCNSVSKFYDALKIDNPMKDELVKSVMVKHKKEKGGAQGQAAPLNFSMLDELYEVLGSSNDIADTRDLVVLSLMLECLMRRAEIVEIQVEHLIVDEEVPLLLVPRSKTDQDGSDQAIVPFSQRTHRLINKWLRMSGITSGYLVRGLKRTKEVRDTKSDVCIVNKIAKRASDILGLEISLSGHSGRVGGIQELVVAGHTETAIQLNARLKTGHMVTRYARRTTATKLPMRDFLKNTK